MVSTVNYWRNNKYTSKLAVVDFPHSGDPMLPILASPLYGDTRHEPFIYYRLSNLYGASRLYLVAENWRKEKSHFELWVMVELVVLQIVILGEMWSSFLSLAVFSAFWKETNALKREMLSYHCVSLVVLFLCDHERILLFLCVGAMVVNCGTDVWYSIRLFAITVMCQYSSIELVRLENWWHGHS